MGVDRPVEFGSEGGGGMGVVTVSGVGRNPGFKVEGVGVVGPQAASTNALNATMNGQRRTLTKFKAGEGNSQFAANMLL